MTREILTASGYDHYEISNYAQPGYQCRHNRVYWENRSYYGFGMGATSYVNRQRFARPRKTKEYYQWVQDFIAAKGVLDCPQTPLEEVLLETLMLGLRLAEGVSLSTLAAQFAEEKLERIQACLHPYHQKGWVEVVGTIVQPYHQKGWMEVVGKMFDKKLRSETRWRLSDPQGFLFSNVVLADLFDQLG
jgi:oxygen-independent coproporphyrinogen-3 oxidase